MMKDRLGQILYVGKAKSLKKRVSTYFQASRRLHIQQPKIAAMIDLIRDIEIIEVKSEAEALLLEGKLIKEWKPRYNTDFIDNKQFLLVRVDVQSTLPRFRLTRNRREDGSRYFGPFAHSGMLRKTLQEMQRKFGILLHDATPKQIADNTWRLYDDARAEIYGQTEAITTDQYHERIEQACVFLEGKTREWLTELEDKMQAAAAKQNFERAAELRDMVLALRKTVEPNRKFTRLQLPAKDYGPALAELQEALQMNKPPETMECFDISHISGTFVVASMVQFKNGRPNKDQYRRFKIKSFVGNDDFRAMEEVVGRRYRRLADEGKPFPDLIVIDGGQGQVYAAVKAFMFEELTPPMLIGLAKREETVVFADDRKPLNLAHSTPGLQMLQQLRDEAHRFANTFNADLRSKKIRESVLDDFSGLGPVRRAALLTHFKGLEGLKKASVEDIKTVEGIGPKMAERLYVFLETHQKAKKEPED